MALVVLVVSACCMYSVCVRMYALYNCIVYNCMYVCRVFTVFDVHTRDTGGDGERAGTRQKRLKQHTDGKHAYMHTCQHASKSRELRRLDCQGT